ncbi:DNA base-flipping protein [Vibrio stylophorae]|uniref:DNA base-flipping protein n=1 Tax=Vibrio stylophorae TaxID=659351 RepID=A0ABN8DUI6_9VIBR|nr:MGMT family protein [Vibrio stylophorae]CAH0533944.1 DNA base-flipping protein [Vibrio stylophorae]
MTLEQFAPMVYSILSQLPEGKVVSYGQIAKMTGYPSYARLVARALKQIPKGSCLPWYRVVNSRYQISLTGPDFVRQKEHLQCEGVLVDAQGYIGKNYRL